MGQTLLAFHAHPDDEALLTSGTMARAAAEGHRVVIVVATDGELGLASEEFTVGGTLAERRMAELRESAAVLGVSRVEHLGYADSGLGPRVYPDPPGRVRFVRADVEEAAQRLAEILREEHADVLLTYDANGGYGHRDHVKVHHVGARAAELAGTPKVLEATVPRDTILRAISLARRVYRFPTDFNPTSSMRAHASQASGGGGADRTLAAFLKIPRPLFDLVFGREWYVDSARTPGSRISRNVFDD